MQDQELDSIGHVQLSKAMNGIKKQNNKTPVESMSPDVSMCLPAEWKDDAKLAICSYLQNWSNMFLVACP